MSELRYIERSREEEESRIVGNWLSRLKSSIGTNERGAFEKAMEAANVSLTDVEKRRNLTQADLDIALNVMHGEVPDILFRLYSNLSVLDLEVLGYAVMSSRSVRKALEVLTRFHELTSDLYDLVIEDNGSGLTIFPVPRPGYLGSFRYISEENTAGIWIVLKTLVEDVQLLEKCKVTFDYSAPDIAESYFNFFGCAVEFDAPMTAIFIPYSIGAMRISNSNRAMVEASSAICDRLLPRSRVREDLQRAVQRLLLSHPEKKMLRLEEAAAELKVSVSQLRKGLYRLGTSYKKIALEVRMALAKHYLAETNLKIDEIAYLLDYAHGGAFSRAFKSAFNCPPIEYRRAVHEQEASLPRSEMTNNGS